LGAIFVGTLTRGAGENVGTYAIGQGSLDNPNYSITYVSANLAIQPKALTVTAEAKSKMYGQVDPALTYTSSGLIGTDALSGSLTRDSGQDVGSYEIRQGTLSAGGNYTLYFTGAQLVIDPLDNSSITITPGSYTYNKLGQGPGIGQTSTSGSTGGVTYTYEGTDSQGNPYGPTSTPPTLPGSYKVKGELAADSNHKGAETTVNFVILPKPITITADAKSKVYGAVDPSLTYKITSGTLETGDSLSGTLDRVSGESVGKYGITSTLANSNYEITYVGAELEITKKGINIAAEPKSKLSGSSDPALTYQVNGLKDGDTLSGSLMREVGEQPGKYVINQGTLGNANYEVFYVGADFVILDSIHPTANTDNLVPVPVRTTKFHVSEILANDTDALNRSLSVTAVSSTSKLNGTVELKAGWVLYTPPAGLPQGAQDSFTYTLSNGVGTATGNVNLIAEEWPMTLTMNLLSVQDVPQGKLVTFSTIPNLTYEVYATSTLSPANWVKLGDYPSNSQGILQVTDTNAGSSRFYRMRTLP